MVFNIESEDKVDFNFINNLDKCQSNDHCNDICYRRLVRHRKLNSLCLNVLLLQAIFTIQYLKLSLLLLFHFIIH